MNSTYTSALFLTFGFFVSSLVLAVSPQISIRSQGQNIIHSVLQQTKKHMPVDTVPVNTLLTDVPVKTASVSTLPVGTVLENNNQKKQPEAPTFFEKITTAATPRGTEQTPEQQTPTKATLPVAPIVKEKQPEAPALFEKTRATPSKVTNTQQQIPKNSAQQKKSLNTSIKKTSPAPIKIPGQTKKLPLKKLTTKRLKDTPSTLITPKKKTNNSNLSPHVTSTQTPEKQKPSNTQTQKRLHSSAPINTHTLPATKKIDQKNNTTACSIVTKPYEKYPAIGDTELSPSAQAFEKYPAIEDKTPSASAQTFEKYPKIDGTLAPSSAATFETYPAIGCDAHETESTQPIQQTPKTRWLDATKRSYKKSVSYFKEFFSPKNPTLINNHSLDNVQLSNAPRTSLNSAPLNSQNATTEVHNRAPLTNEINIAGNFTLQLECMRSFRPHALTRAFFGCDLYNDTTIHIRGSALARNEEKDWLADYFYLSNNYESIVCFTPRVTSFLTDLSLFIDLNSWFKGSFLRVQSPLTWTKWDLGMREQIINSGNVTGAQGWRGNWTSADNKLLSSFTDYAAWEKAGTSYTDGAGLAYPLYAAKLCSCGKAQTALADIHVDFGLYAHEGNHYHVGAYAHGVMPTDTQPSGEFLFEPIVGNGHFWELGGGINGYAQLWTDNRQSKEVGLYVDGSITHLFNSRQQRVFDLKHHGPLSRYLLLTNSATAPSSITPAANITSAQIHVSIPVQVDLVTLINFANDAFSWNVGYNFWARSCEKIDCCDIITSQLCDNCSAASGLDSITWKPYTDSTIKNLGSSSLAPALSPDDLNLQASRTKGSSHKIFTSLNYSWVELDDVVVPFLGIGTEIEFGNSSAVSSNTCCNQVSLSQWGLWLRAGTEF